MKKSRLLILLLAFIAGITISNAQVTKDAQDLYDQGLQLKEDRKVKEALEKFKLAIAKNSGFADALYQAGWCQNDLGNYNDAIEYLRRARQPWSLIPKVHFELGYAFEKSGNTDSAIKCYNRCIDLKPAYANAYKQLGFIAHFKGDYAAALAYYKKYELYAASNLLTDYLYWYRKGFAFNATGDYANAKVTLQKSLHFKPDYINTQLELGYASNKMKQAQDAIDHFKKAIELDPKNYVAYNGIAEVYLDNMKDADQAMVWYGKSLAVEPTERKANFGMGFCLNSKQKFSEAVNYLKKAIEKEPSYAAAYTELGFSYFKTGKDADAESQFIKALKISPKNENTLYYACLLYIKQKNKAKAQKMLNELKAISSKNAAALQPKVKALK